MSEQIHTTIYAGDISRGLLTVHLHPDLITGIKLGSAIGIVLNPQLPTDPLADHPQLALEP